MMEDRDAESAELLWEVVPEMIRENPLPIVARPGIGGIYKNVAAFMVLQKAEDKLRRWVAKVWAIEEGCRAFWRRRTMSRARKGFNSKIRVVKADAWGFRNFLNYRARILFFCWKPDLLPIRSH